MTLDWASTPHSSGSSNGEDLIKESAHAGKRRFQKQLHRARPGPWTFRGKQPGHRITGFTASLRFTVADFHPSWGVAD